MVCILVPQPMLSRALLLSKFRDHGVNKNKSIKQVPWVCDCMDYVKMKLLINVNGNMVTDINSQSWPKCKVDDDGDDDDAPSIEP